MVEYVIRYWALTIIFYISKMLITCNQRQNWPKKVRVLQTYSRSKKKHFYMCETLLYRSTFIFDCFYWSRTLSNLPLICLCLMLIYMGINSLVLPLDIILRWTDSIPPQVLNCGQDFCYLPPPFHPPHRYFLVFRWSHVLPIKYQT